MFWVVLWAVWYDTHRGLPETQRLLVQSGCGVTLAHDPIGEMEVSNLPGHSEPVIKKSELTETIIKNYDKSTA